jgi:hypothetical protein
MHWPRIRRLVASTAAMEVNEYPYIECRTAGLTLPPFAATVTAALQGFASLSFAVGPLVRDSDLHSRRYLRTQLRKY